LKTNDYFSLESFSLEKLSMLKLVGVDSGGETPDPISNSAVKPASGDGNAEATLCESSTMPALFFKPIFG
jgi:hypothetical protein